MISPLLLKSGGGRRAIDPAGQPGSARNRQIIWRGNMTSPRSALSRTSNRMLSWCLALIVVLVGFTGSSSIVMAEDLRWHLETLAAERGFRIESVDLIGDEQKSNHKTKKLANRISQLLANYNFIISRDSQDRIAQLTIVGLGISPTATPPAPENIKTERYHSEHYVEVILTGPNGQFMPLKFMVYTGASTLLLPQSLGASLGYAANQLESVHV